MNKASMNLLELVFCRHKHSFLLGKFPRVQLWDYKVCLCFISLNIGSSSKRTQTSPFLPSNHALLPPLKHLPSAAVIRLLPDLHFSPHRTSSHPSRRLTKQWGPYRLPDLYTHPSTCHKEASDKYPAHHKDTQVSFPFFSNTEAQSSN